MLALGAKGFPFLVVKESSNCLEVWELLWLALGFKKPRCGARFFKNECSLVRLGRLHGVKRFAVVNLLRLHCFMHGFLQLLKGAHFNLADTLPTDAVFLR